MVTRAHVLPYIGQRVVVRTKDGMICHGILHSVSNDGIYMRSIGQNRVTSGQKNPSVDLLMETNQNQTDIQEAWAPFFFLPWLWIGAFWPWGLWW